MISDTLFDAAEEIRGYLNKGWYGDPGDRDREAIENLLQHMDAVRCLPGFDLAPDAAKAALDLAAIQDRWGPHQDGRAQAFPLATLDELLALKRPVEGGR